MSSSSSISKAAFWTGVALAVPPVFMLLMSGVMKIMHTEEVVKGFADWPAGSATAIGVLELAWTVIYLIPRTSVLGAILLAGHLGGAVALTVKMGMVGMALLPALFGVLLWGSLWLREPRLRALIPLRR